MSKLGDVTLAADKAAPVVVEWAEAEVAARQDAIARWAKATEEATARAAEAAKQAEIMRALLEQCTRELAKFEEVANAATLAATTAAEQAAIVRHCYKLNAEMVAEDFERAAEIVGPDYDDE